MTLELRDLSIAHKRGAALVKPLSLHIAGGQVGAIMGPSGCGKSTLLAAIGGHLTRDFTCHGGVLLDGKDITHLPVQARRIGIMFQDALLFPHLSVGGNLAFGLDPAQASRAARRAAVAQALEMAGLTGMENRDPATLSGGERARVALMRSLLARPKAILLDEPFSKLDTALRAEFRAFAFDHIKASGIPALMVTHDPSDIAQITGPVINLS